jgi:hypothetical protein
VLPVRLVPAAISASLASYREADRCALTWAKKAFYSATFAFDARRFGVFPVFLSRIFVVGTGVIAALAKLQPSMYASVR